MVHATDALIVAQMSRLHPEQAGRPESCATSRCFQQLRRMKQIFSTLGISRNGNGKRKFLKSMSFGCNWADTHIVFVRESRMKKRTSPETERCHCYGAKKRFFPLLRTHEF
jgi:hypothetical protein